MISKKIHYDTDAEQSRKLRELLSLTEEQDEMIAENSRKDVVQDEMLAHIDSYNHMQDTKMQEHREHLEKMIKEIEGDKQGGISG